MKTAARITLIAVVTAFGAGVLATDAYAARTAYGAKKAECKQRAKQMNFGVHLVKKNRWVKDCIAGAH
jgi:hypothetical protein